MSIEKFIVVLILLFFTHKITGQCHYQKVPINDVVNGSTTIFDGQVISFDCVWNESKSMIYTRYGIEVYNHLKGTEADIQYFYSPGGVIGLNALRVEPSVHPEILSFGMFLCRDADPKSGLPPGALVTGFGHLSWYNYNFENYIATGIFESYNLKNKELTRIIEDLSGNRISEKKRLPSQFKRWQTDSRAITGFTPSNITAGTASVLTINGNNFGTVADTVFFINASDPTTYAFTFPTQIVSWSANQITVQVPFRAGTGPVYVSTSTTAGPSQVSANDLTILSAQTNVNYQNKAYITRHSTLVNIGKLVMELNTDFSNNNDARLAFARAMKTWRCTNNVNIEISNATTAVNTIANDDVNVVKFSQLTGQLGITYTYYQGCFIGGILYWHTTELDMEYDDIIQGFSWNFSTSAPTINQFDFESVVLHELGHALLLNHVIDENKVMHRFITNGSSKRVPSTDEVTAVNSVMQRSLSNTNMCGFFPITAPGNIAVSSTSDSGTGSLRQALADVCTGDTIVFSLPVSSTITLTSAEILVENDAKILGPGANNLTLSGNNARRIFNVLPGKNFTLQDVKLINATSVSNGGAIYNQGNLSLKNVIFQNNSQGTLKKAFTSPNGTAVRAEGNMEIRQ